MKKISIAILLLYSLLTFGQTATIKAVKVFPDAKETITFIKFEINGQKFGEKDTVIKIKINKSGLDKCTAIINTDTLNFLTKFKENETYALNQGCCCAAFTLEALNNPRRGVVTFKNKTPKDVCLIVAETNIDTVKVGKRQTTFALESAMCYFKPCSILLTDTSYSSSEDYKLDIAANAWVWKEKEKHQLACIWFHFLHGEKIEVVYNPENREARIKLLGYLSEKEYAKRLLLQSE